jgi:hypothetical protein
MCSEKAYDGVEAMKCNGSLIMSLELLNEDGERGRVSLLSPSPSRLSKMLRTVSLV